jgi:hypothetical protein
MTKFLLVPGGSERGLSYWSSVLPCPRAHWFRYREFPDKPKSWGKGCAETGKLNPLMVGTLTHAYLESYYTTGTTSKLVFEDSLTGELLEGFTHEESEAWRLAAAYFQEYRLAETHSAVVEEECRDDTGELGVPLLTTRIDMTAINGSVKNLDIGLPEGKYLWEHKTAGSKSSYLFEEHRIQVQTNCYLYNRENPADPVLGGILNNIVKTAKPSFQRVYIPLAGIVEISNLTQTLTFTNMIHEQYGEQMVANKNSCTNGWSPCSYYSRCFSPNT